MAHRICRANRRHLADINRIITGVNIGGPLDEIPDLFWFARADGHIVGCVGGEFVDDDTFIILYLAVERSHQKKHIGMDLLDHAMRYARGRGAKRFALITMYYRFNWFKRRGFGTIPRAQLPTAVRDHWMFTERRYMKCAAMIAPAQV